MFGYNVADWDQIGLMGEGLIPGALNQPLYARPTAFSHGLREQEFSPVAEMRVQASYHVTKGVRAEVRLHGLVRRQHPPGGAVGALLLPDMGYVDTGSKTS